MTISDTTESAILRLTFMALAWASYADNAASTPQSQIGVSLHTADPTDAGTATASEVAYSGYGRVNVPRGTGTPGWSETTGAVSPTTNIDFTASASGTATATYFATGKSTATPPVGAQAILWSGTISPSIVCSAGVTPRLTTASTLSLD